jgi:hypothetical protein
VEKEQCYFWKAEFRSDLCGRDLDDENLKACNSAMYIPFPLADDHLLNSFRCCRRLFLRAIKRSMHRLMKRNAISGKRSFVAITATGIWITRT